MFTFFLSMRSCWFCCMIRSLSCLCFSASSWAFASASSLCNGIEKSIIPSMISSLSLSYLSKWNDDLLLSVTRLVSVVLPAPVSLSPLLPYEPAPPLPSSFPLFELSPPPNVSISPPQPDVSLLLFLACNDQKLFSYLVHKLLCMYGAENSKEFYLHVLNHEAKTQ